MARELYGARVGDRPGAGRGGVRTPRAARRLPRWLVILGVPLLALCVITLFALALFPYDRLRHPLTAELQRVTGAQVTIQSMGPTFGLLGPAFELLGVQVRWPDGRSLACEYARVRPAWSLSWLSGSAALRLDVASGIGRADGTLWLGAEPGFDGDLEDVALAQLPGLEESTGASLDGIADIEVDLRLVEGAPRGDVRFEARNGSVAAGGLPVALPYTTFDGALDFDDAGGLAVERIDLDGPMLAAQVSGRVDGVRNPASARLDLVVDLDVREPSLIPMFRSQGAQLGADGKGRIEFKGPARQLGLR